MDNPSLKKIFFVLTKSNLGGAQRYVYDLATSLPKEKYNVTVIFGGHGLLEKKLAERGVKTISLACLDRDVNPFLDIQAFYTLFSILKSEQPDIVHLNSSKIGALGSLAARFAHVPRIIFTAHGWAFNEDRSWISKKLITVAHWITVLATHTTITVSLKTRQDIERLPGVHTKLVSIHNGIEPTEVLSARDSRQELIKQHPILATLTDKIWIGTTSELHRNKGLDFMIEAMLPFKEKAAFIIMGDGEERKKLEKLAQSLGASHVLFLGFTADAARYLKAFDIFTLTSRTEALPYSILEAGAAGLPIVASRVGGIPEILEHSRTGLLVQPGNIVEIRQSLSKLIDNAKNRTTFGEEISKKIRHDFTVKRMVWETEMLYTLHD